MNREKIEYLCKCQSVITGIPIKLYENGKLVYKHEEVAFPDDLGNRMFEQLRDCKIPLICNLSDTSVTSPPISNC